MTVYTLIWITFDKYWSFVKPFKLRMSIKICKYLILVSWLFSMFVSLPIAFFTKLVYSTDDTNDTNETNSNNDSLTVNNLTIANVVDQIGRPNCVEQWPDSMGNASEVYNIVLLLIQYFIPLVIMTYCYVRIYIVLMRTKPSYDTVNLRDERTIKSKRRVSWLWNVSQ